MWDQSENTYIYFTNEILMKLLFFPSNCNKLKKFWLFQENYLKDLNLQLLAIFISIWIHAYMIMNQTTPLNGLFLERSPELNQIIHYDSWQMYYLGYLMDFNSQDISPAYYIKWCLFIIYEMNEVSSITNCKTSIKLNTLPICVCIAGTRRVWRFHINKSGGDSTL